jgi:hypothetical protein
LRRRLLLLDVVLVGLVAYAGWQVWQADLRAKAREAAMLHRKVKPDAPPPFTPLPAQKPVIAGGYADIAQQTLFDKSRNPTVVVELPPPPAPPPPPPMPPLPVYHGQMNIGGITVFLSQNAASVHEAIHPGEKIGQFKLVDVNMDEIEFEWDGKTVRRKIDAILDRSNQPPPAAAAPAPVARTDASAASATAPPVAKSAIGPGADTGRGFKLCDPNDNMPVGSVVDGYRKMNYPGFGNTIACRWDQIGYPNK